MSCRHCCINSKKSFSKTFSLHKIIYKYFAGFLACYLDCHASLHQRWADARSARNDEKNKNRTRCAPHGDDDNKNFQFDKFQRLFSVIYKKLINYKGDFKMRNQTNNVFKVKRQKSKLFLIILCVFGLLFSYSCSCKNRVSNPDDTPTDGGTNIKPDTNNRTSGGAVVSSNHQIVVASAGDTVKTTATVKFLNATGTLTAIADADATASTPAGLTLDDFDYTGTTLTFKKDTTDASKIDTTLKDKITWSGAETRKVKATFSLEATATNVDLTTTTQDVEIEIGKLKAAFNLKEEVKKFLIDNNENEIELPTRLRFQFSSGTATDTGMELKLKNQSQADDKQNISIQNFAQEFVTLFSNPYSSKYFLSNIEWTDNIDTITVPTDTKLTLNFSATVASEKANLYESITNPITLVVVADASWTDDGTSKTATWVK